MIEKKEYLIETDILFEHLTHTDHSTKSHLELIMTMGVCYTTVINSAEIFFKTINEEEQRPVNDLIKSLKVLGLNARYSLSISDYYDKVYSVRDALICSVAKNNNLPIFTAQIEKFCNCGLEIISPSQLKDKID